MSKRGSGIVSTFSFAAVLVLAEVAARTVAPTLPVDPGKWPRIEIAQKLDQVREYVNDDREFDAVFVGSSMMAGGIDPVAFTRRADVRGYNAAFSGPSMRTIEPWTLDIVEPLLQPEAIVLGIQSRELSNNGPKNKIMFDSFVESPGYKETTSNIALRLGGVLERASYFLRYRRAFREPSELFGAEGSVALDAASVRQDIGPLGMRIQHDIPYHDTQEFRDSLYEKMLYDFEVLGPEYTALERLYRGLEERGVRLVIVNMPVTDAYWEAHRAPSARRRYHQALESFLDDANVTFIDAEDVLSEDAFRNPMHLDIHARRWIGRALAVSWDDLMTDDAARFELVCNEPRAKCTVE